MNVKDLSDDALLQALRDSENESSRLLRELRIRAESRNPALFRAVGDATRKALSVPTTVRRLFEVGPADDWWVTDGL